MTNSQTTTAGKEDKRFHLAWAGIQSGKPFLIFGLIAFSVMLGGDYVFDRYKKEIKTETQEELSGIAKLKTEQITNWIAKFRGNAQTISEDPLFLAEVEHWLQQGGPAGAAKARLAERLALLQRSEANSGCTAISFIDGKGKLRISTAPQTPSASGQELLVKSMRTGQTLFSDIYAEKNKNTERLEIDLVAPLYTSTNGKERNIGAILFA